MKWLIIAWGLMLFVQCLAAWASDMSLLWGVGGTVFWMGLAGGFRRG